MLLVEAQDHHEALNDTPVELLLVYDQNFANIKRLLGYFSLDILQNIRGGKVVRVDFNLIDSCVLT